MPWFVVGRPPFRQTLLELRTNLGRRQHRFPANCYSGWTSAFPSMCSTSIEAPRPVPLPSVLRLP